MSKTHCRFDFLDSQWFISDERNICDKSSGNGTWLYCDQEAPLKDGDVIMAGTSIF